MEHWHYDVSMKSEAAANVPDIPNQFHSLLKVSAQQKSKHQTTARTQPSHRMPAATYQRLVYADVLAR